MDNLNLNVVLERLKKLTLTVKLAVVAVLLHLILDLVEDSLPYGDVKRATLVSIGDLLLIIALLLCAFGIIRSRINKSGREEK